MLREKLIQTDLYPYHVTTRSFNKERFKLSMNEVWSIAQKCLYKTYNHYPFELYAFVLMSNHYHLLLRTPNRNLDQIVLGFNHLFSKSISQRTSEEKKIFDHHYKWSLIDNKAYLFNVILYVYQNPVRANLVQGCEDYPFSDLYYQIRNIPFSIPTHNFYFLDQYFLKRINTRSKNKDDQRIRNGLKQSRFLF